MDLKFVASDIDALKMGVADVDKVYLGATEVWSRGVAPVWLTISAQSVGYNKAFNLNLNSFVTGTPDPTITVSGLPSGLSIANAVITGKSTNVGIHTIEVTATNVAGTAPTSFRITVLDKPPAWTGSWHQATLTQTSRESARLGRFNLNFSYNYDLSSYVTGENLVWSEDHPQASITSQGVLQVNFRGASGSGFFTQTVNVTVSNSGGSITQALLFRLNRNPRA